MKIQIDNSESNAASTLSGVRVAKHTMSKSSINLQMLMLRTGLYSDKIAAVVREYLTNARDAHVDAGHSKAIDITVPNRFGSDVVIRDYGMGMSPDFIEKVYVQYTASTKRDTEEMTGGWGIGSKSGYAYSDSFTVISIHNGVKYTWLAQSRADGSGDFSLVSSVDTIEPSGVEIRLSLLETSDAYRFVGSVEHFSQFIDMPVNLNGALQEKELSEKVFSSEEVTVSFEKVPNQDRYNRKVFIVQGGVPYPVEISAIKNELVNSTVIDFACSWNCYSSLCIYVPPGTFMPDISREKIQFDSSGNTLAGIVNYISLADNHVLEVFDKYMASANVSNQRKLAVSFGHSIFDFSYSDSSDDSLNELMTPMILKIFGSKIKNIFSSAISRKKNSFSNTSTIQYRRVERDYNGGVTTSRMDGPTYEISRSLSKSASSSLVIAFSRNSYKRNVRLSSLFPKPDVFVHSKEESFEEYKKFIYDSFSDEEYSFCGTDPSTVTIVELPTVSSTTRRTGGRRATKFLKVDSVGYCGTVATSAIPKDKVETDAKIVFGLLYRNKIVDEDGEEVNFPRFLRKIVDTNNNSNIAFRVIKLADFKKNKTLTRGKVDYSEMIRVEEFYKIAMAYNKYNYHNTSLQKNLDSVGWTDGGFPESVVSAVKICQEKIKIILDDIGLESLGLSLDHMVSASISSHRNPDLLINTQLESILKTDSGYNAIKKFVSNEISSYDNWCEIDRKVLVLSKMIPSIFE